MLLMLNAFNVSTPWKNDSKGKSIKDIVKKQIDDMRYCLKDVIYNFGLPNLANWVDHVIVDF